jgi:CheY-like chemotaxis protein
MPLAVLEDMQTSGTSRVSNGRPTVLVVEADLLVRRLIVRLLGREGVSVIAAGDVAEAIAHLDSNAAIDLTIEDGMAEELAPGVRARLARRRRGISTILTCGEERRSPIVDSAKVALLERPFTIQSFRAVVRLCLGLIPESVTDA